MNFYPGTVVWKYPLPEPETVLTFASGSILRVDVQESGLQAWVAVTDPDGTCTRRVVVVGTGEPLPEGPQLDYLNTFTSGPFVFHAFVGYPHR